MKIAYLLPGGLFNSGGMERVVSIKANYFVENLNYDVSIVTTEQMGRPVFYPLSEKIHLYHLNIGMYENFGNESYLRKCISRFRNTGKYKKALNKLLCQIRPDITISTLGGLDIDFLNDLKDGSIKLGELHFPGNFRSLMARKLSTHFIPRWIAQIRTQSFLKKCNRLTQLIVLTQEEKSFWKNKDNIRVIPNPLSFYPETTSLLNRKEVIAVGRLAYEKGFDMLIAVWQIVAEKHPDWKLNIFGSGNQKQDLQQSIKEKRMEFAIKIHEPVNDIQNRYSEHSLFVFSSRYLDALPMVLLEAMACGLPLVSFNSPCGPKDLITDGGNGFLVETGDINAMAEKIITIIESPELRKSMGKAGRMFSVNFQVENVMKQWVDLFENLTKK